VEEVVLAYEEDAGKLLIVVGHHDILRRTLAKTEKCVDVFNAAESFLPKLKLYGNVELLEAGIEMSLKSIGVVEIDGVHLRRVLGSIRQMITKKLAQSAKLGLAGILLTELEGLEGSGLIHDLEASIVLEDFEDGAIGFP
jgi:hypothetical protein